MKNFIVFCFIVTLLAFSQISNAATYKNGVLSPSTLSTQQSNTTNQNIRNDVIDYNATLSDKTKETKTKTKNDSYNKQENTDKNLDPNPNWWRWENSPKGYSYFY